MEDVRPGGVFLVQRAGSEAAMQNADRGISRGAPVELDPSLGPSSAAGGARSGPERGGPEGQDLAKIADGAVRLPRAPRTARISEL